MGKWLDGVLESEPTDEFGKSWEIDPPIKFGKPCHQTGFCVYGSLVEEFPLERGRWSCQVFGHDCPVFYMAEPLTEDLDIPVEKVTEK